MIIGGNEQRDRIAHNGYYLVASRTYHWTLLLIIESALEAAKTSQGV
jgi:hypothetical protein